MEKILKISDSQDEVFKYIDIDPTVYVTQIGNEDVTFILKKTAASHAFLKVTKEDKRLEGINLLGSPFLRETGFFLPDENDKYKIKIQYGNVVSKKTANKIQYK
eukprot:gene3882-7096_t